MSDDEDPADAAPQYKVGYGRPPVEHRFKPGVSGNIRGRRPKTKNIETLLELELDSLITVKENRRSKRIPKRELIIKQFVANMIKGDHKSIEQLLKFGRSNPRPEPVEFELPDDADLAKFLEPDLKGVERYQQVVISVWC